MNKKIIIILLIILVVLGIVCLKKSNHIPNDYIAIFNGDSGHSTYIYKVKNGKSNFGFKYINVTSSMENSKTIIKITEKGKVSFTDDCFSIAKENNAYSYVAIPNDDKTYSIDEFRIIFSLD